MTETIYMAGTLFSHEEKVVLGWCGDSRYAGYGIGGFMRGLMAAFTQADTRNFERLAQGFPELAEAWRSYRRGEFELRERAAKSLAHRALGQLTMEQIRAEMVRLDDTHYDDRRHALTSDPGDETRAA